MPIPVILDCDPGHDDAMAILLAVANPAIDLLAVSTVAGNQTVEKTALNARRMLSLAGVTGVPVAAGCDRPLTGTLEVGDYVHGESGLDGPAFGEPNVPLDPRHGVELIHDTLAAADEPVTIVAIGPLTNIATLFRRYPGDRDRIREIVIMGGSTERGNHTPYAEFNIVTDPEAAAEVLDSGVPTTWVGLNVSHQALVTRDVLDRIAALDTPLARVCVELLTFFGSSYHQAWGFEAPPLHDPITIAYLIDPQVMTYARVGLRIELEGAYTRGATVADLHGRMDWEPNANVGLILDRDRFWDLMIGAIETLGASK
ncbi:nucleoside hydrolase [Microtetraspora sp. NBRC 16547]|uniref:nucleoside hydrolase n=1 Tax=Microtetraspora sp. NBRC 16547 TaxID=3030993 RepID=UPI0024A08243|nr:nucleoside hydrolase [Microtetraspora sp. NBRC 16547]GLW99254.1 ribosylpyrimidine nucleosidase [Microtetraspora sp. NBRC 16547]